MRHANLDAGAAAGFAAAISPIGETAMTMEFDRRSLLQAGAIAGAAAASAAPANAQHAPAKLSTHALDMYLGKQAAGIRIDFSKKEGDAWKLIKTVTADENGPGGGRNMRGANNRGGA